MRAIVIGIEPECRYGKLENISDGSWCKWTLYQNFHSHSPSWNWIVRAFHGSNASPPNTADIGWFVFCLEHDKIVDGNTCLDCERQMHFYLAARTKKSWLKEEICVCYKRSNVERFTRWIFAVLHAIAFSMCWCTLSYFCFK